MSFSQLEVSRLLWRPSLPYTSPDSSPILNELSLRIRPGEKVAICGPSGSGKTSLILGLLQMIDLREGGITIDGADLSTLTCGAVRSRINVVPQEPFFMPGSLRFNLDRGLNQDKVSDTCLIQVLETVGLWKKVSGYHTTTSEALDQPLSISDWSMGERQLFALARALVTQSPILVLDEATSRYVLFLSRKGIMPVMMFWVVAVWTGRPKPPCKPLSNRGLQRRRCFRSCIDCDI